MEFLLERDSNSNYLTDYIKSVYEDGSSYDVVLVVDHIQLKAHRSILAACSQYFRFLLKEHMGDELYISLEGFRIEEVQKLLEFVYTGAATVPGDEETSFTNILRQLEIGGTKQAIVTENADIETQPFFEFQEVQEGVFVEVQKPTSVKGHKSYKCEVCGQVLKTKTGLRMHLLVHQGSKAKVFTCDVCGKGFSQASQLKTHMRIHTGEKPYKCDVCEKSFSHASTLSEHKNLHDALKPYQCTICKQSYAQKKGLRSHSCGEDPVCNISKKFICPYCRRPFGSRRGLAIHKMHQHAETSASDEPILQCHLCSSTFSSELAFETHMLKH